MIDIHRLERTDKRLYGKNIVTEFRYEGQKVLSVFRLRYPKKSKTHKYTQVLKVFTGSGILLQDLESALIDYGLDFRNPAHGWELKKSQIGVVLYAREFN